MYRVETVGDDIDAAIAALPPELLAAFAELRVALEVAPWGVGEPYVAANPGGSRTASFGLGGRGMVLFVVQEYEQVVAIWQVTAYRPRLTATCPGVDDALGAVEWTFSIDSSSIRAHQHASGAASALKDPLVRGRGAAQWLKTVPAPSPSPSNSATATDLGAPDQIGLNELARP